MKFIGAANVFPTFNKQSHGWSEGMNQNLVKMAMLLHASCDGMVGALPGSPDVNDTYIYTADKSIYVWVDAVVDPTAGINDPAQWYVVTPVVGLTMMVADQEKYFTYTIDGVWTEVWDMNATHRSLARPIAFDVPYRLRSGAKLFEYVAGMEFTIPAGAPGSGAFLDVAPTGGDLVLTIQHNSSTVGTITFDEGETEGVVDIPDEVVVYNSVMENEWMRAHNLTVLSPANTRLAEGLGVTFLGKIRAID